MSAKAQNVEQPAGFSWQLNDFEKETILVVEDSEDDAELLKLAFKAARAKNPLVIFPSVKEAEDYLAGCYPYRDRLFFPLPVTILSDLKMPGADGFSLLRWVKTRPELRHLTMIVMTNSNAREDMELAYDLGANFFLTKPTRFQDLVHLVSSVVQWLSLHRHQAETAVNGAAKELN